MRKEVIAHKDPKSPVSEIFRTLRTNIQFMNTNRKLKTLLVTSTFPGEGKSWIVSNLAVTFAQAGKKVVLIDADMRKGRQYAIFGISPRPGLSNYLSQVEIDENEQTSEDIVDYIQGTDVPNLYVISAGNVPPNPSELLVSAQMIKLLDELKDLCDLIIIDGTPCELVTDSIILSRIVDSTVIVTANKQTKKDALERVIKNIQNVGGKMAGVVINKVTSSARGYGDRYYYYGEDKSLKTKHKTNRPSNFMANNQKERMTKTIEMDRKPKALEKQEGEINRNIEEQEKNIHQVESKNNEIEQNQSANNSQTSVEKTNEILKQINDYLEQEKKTLN